MPIIKEKNNILNSVKFNSFDVGLDFYYSTRWIPKISKLDSKNINQYLINNSLTNENINHYKTYRNNKKIKLEADLSEEKMKFVNTVLSRTSIRDYKGDILSFKKFSNLLMLSYGLNGKNIPCRNTNDKKLQLRTVPSAGALYPLEVYPVIFNVENINPGLYHYNPRNFEIECLKEGDYKPKIKEIYQGADSVLENSNVIFIITGVFERTVIKYGKRGWRFIFLDAGHLGQNFYLASTALELGCTTIGGGYDNLVADFLEIDGIQEGLVYSAAVGTLI